MRQVAAVRTSTEIAVLEARALRWYLQQCLVVAVVVVVAIMVKMTISIIMMMTEMTKSRTISFCKSNPCLDARQRGFSEVCVCVCV